MGRLRSFLKTDVGLIVVAAVLVVVLQVVVALWTAFEVGAAIKSISSKLDSLQAASGLGDEKTRQEVLNLRIQNELKGFLSNSLLISIGPTVTAFVALVGALLGLRNYLQMRDKERIDRASAELKNAMDRLVANEPMQRAAGVLGLQHFLSTDLHDYHLRAVSALAMAVRTDSDPVVANALRVAVEQAINTVDEAVLQQVSWQGARLGKLRLSRPRLLRNLDLRDAALHDSDLRGCDLSGCLLANARLNGAKLDGCKLEGADLSYADLAGASLRSSDLTAAQLYNVKVLQLDLAEADLRRTLYDPEALPWELTLNWRAARLQESVRGGLIQRYGEAPSGPKILMLMWELPPFVAGGTWTACYHLVRNLRRTGADVTVLVPWSESLVVTRPFGSEVRVVCLGIVPPELEGREASGDEARSWSPYARASPIYGSYAEPSWSAYGGSQRFAYASSPYSRSGVPAGSRWTPYGGPRPGSSQLLRLMDETRLRLLRFARNESFDVIHAHDWVTFEAARALAESARIPWIAHFHSTEADRRGQLQDQLIREIEKQALLGASAVVAPSRFTATRLANEYGAAPDRVVVAPNCLSKEPVPTSQLGLFETRRVLYLGRFAQQKGTDLFVAIASAASNPATRPKPMQGEVTAGEELHFEARGGSVADLPSQPFVKILGPLDWAQRGLAFSDVSALVVPSRAEPFGMVILEGMLHRVPVLFPATAGAAEVLRSGIRIDPVQPAQVLQHLVELLARRDQWETLVREQAREVGAYAERGYEDLVLAIYARLCRRPAAAAKG